MKAKPGYLFALIVAAGVFSQPASAISEAYRAQLENSGCTQVSETNGSCNAQAEGYHRRSREYADDPPSTQSLSARLDRRIAGDYQGEAADYMEAHG